MLLGIKNKVGIDSSKNIAENKVKINIAEK